MFIGRKEELRKLKEALEGNDYRSVRIYGRRRVGKTELIKRALRDEKGTLIHFECKRALASINLDLLSKQVKEVLKLPEYIRFTSFDELFEAVFQASLKNKIVFVLDEFSYLPLGLNGVDASLARVMDRQKSRETKLKIIISGSYIDLRQNLLSQSSPLHGHFDLIEEIHEFDYYDAAKFFPDYSNEDKFIAYSVFGGLPYSLSLVNPDKSILDNIKDLFCVDVSSAILLCQDRVQFEGAKLAPLNSILVAVASGKHRFSDLVSVFGKAGRPEYALAKGVERHYLKKTTPINAEDNKKLTYYSIDDNLLNFYFRYIFSAGPSSLFLGKDLFFDEIISDDFIKSYLPGRFEKVSKEFLIRKNRKGQIHPPFLKIGTYSYNNAEKKANFQFDIVTKDKEGYTSYECKYTKKPIDSSVLSEEEKQSRSAPLPFIRLGYISKSGFADNLKINNGYFYCLDDFYNPDLDE